MRKQAVRTEAAPPPGGSYSQAIRYGGLLFISGQTPRDTQRQPVPGPFRNQADRVFANLLAIAFAAGSEPADALHLTVYLEDFKDFQEMDQAFAAAFPEPRPARTTVQSDIPVPIEVDGVFAAEAPGPQ